MIRGYAKINSATASELSYEDKLPFALDGRECSTARGSIDNSRVVQRRCKKEVFRHFPNADAEGSGCVRSTPVPFRCFLKLVDLFDGTGGLQPIYMDTPGVLVKFYDLLCEGIEV